MDYQILLKKLKKLYNERIIKSFDKYAILTWANKVAPLLKFNEIYYKIFMIRLNEIHAPVPLTIIEPRYREMISQVEQAINELKLKISQGETTKDSNNFNYVNIERINDLKRIKSNNFDYKKVIEILDELNNCNKTHSYLAIALLVRSLIDHIPPIFSCKTFIEVINNYNGSKSFKNNMKKFNDTARNIADQYLHGQIRSKESLPTFEQINFSHEIDVLIAEILRLGQ